MTITRGIKGGSKFSFRSTVTEQISASVFVGRLAASQLGLRDQQREHDIFRSWHSYTWQEARIPQYEL